MAGRGNGSSLLAQLGAEGSSEVPFSLEPLRLGPEWTLQGPRLGALIIEKERDGGEEVWVQALALPQTIPSLAEFQKGRRQVGGGKVAVCVSCTEPSVKPQKARLWCPALW